MVLSAAAITGCTRTATTTADTAEAADEAAAPGDAAASPHDGAQAGQPTTPEGAASAGAEPAGDETASLPAGTVADPVPGSDAPDASGTDDSSAPPESGSDAPDLRDPSPGGAGAPSGSADPGAGGPAESAPPGEQGEDTEEPGGDDGDGMDLDVREHTVVSLLAAARDANGAPRLDIDPGLVVAARDHACAIAQGASPLVPEEHAENVGLVVEPEPDAAGRAMHNWWMQSEQPRAIRLASGFTRYGVGACTIDDRTYYAERFAS